MGAFLDRIGSESPIVQAGMGGGLAGSELAAAVSEAGGLGTIGILGPEEIRREVAAVRRLTDRPVSVNLLLPFARRPHFEAAADADVLTTFWGSPKRRAEGIWIHQVGSAEGPPNLVDAWPLYAGECIERIDDVLPAAEITRDLTP